jgi:hypothetical protein
MIFIEESIVEKSDVAGASIIGVLKSMYRTLSFEIVVFSVGRDENAPTIKVITTKISRKKPIIHASNDAPRVFKNSILIFLPNVTNSNTEA